MFEDFEETPKSEPDENEFEASLRGYMNEEEHLKNRKYVEAMISYLEGNGGGKTEELEGYKSILRNLKE